MELKELPKQIIEQTTKEVASLRVLFEVENENKFVFRNVNDAFLNMHKALGIGLDEKDILLTELTNYFTWYLGFTMPEIEDRMKVARQAVETMKPCSQKEISTMKDGLMVLQTTWIPELIDDRIFVWWNSQEFPIEDVKR